MVLPNYPHIKKVIAFSLVITFLFSNVCPAFSLAPSTGFDPIAVVEKGSDGALNVVDTADARARQKDESRDRTVLKYLDGLMVQVFALRLTDSGLKDFLQEHISHIKSIELIYPEISMPYDGSFLIPYKTPDGERATLHYWYVKDRKTVPAERIAEELLDGGAVCREVLGRENRYIGSAHDIYTLISSPEYQNDPVHIEALRVRTNGRMPDGHLSFSTVKRDLENLRYFGLVSKEGKGRSALYRAVPVNKKLYRVIESFLSSIPKKPPTSREKAVIRNDLYRIMNQEVSQADLIAAKPVMTIRRSFDDEDKTVRSVLYTIMTAKEVAKYKVVATAFLEALKRDYVFSEEEIAAIEKLKGKVNSWHRDYHDIGKFQSEFERILRSQLKLDTRVLQRRQGKGLLRLEKYVVTLGTIFFDPSTARSPRAEPFITHIVESAFDDSYAKDINLTAPWRSYHLWNDSAVAYWENMEFLRKPEKAVYKPRFWEKAPRQCADSRLIHKIDEAIRLARQRIGNMPAGVATAMGPKDFDELIDKTTIMMIDSPLSVILADPANNVVRPLSNGRRRQVLYIPRLFLEDFNADDQEDMKELATHILHSVEWSYAYRELQKKNEKSGKIYQELNLLTTRFTITDRYGLVSPETIRKRLFKLMKRSLIAQCTVLTPQLLAKYKTICEWTEDLDTHYPDGYIYTEIGFGQEGDVRAAFRHLERELASGVLYFDLLGLHDMAQEFFRERERNIRIIQASDIGDLPNYLQLELVFFYLRHGDISHFLQNLEMLLTGNGFPERSARFAQLSGKNPDVLQREQIAVLRDFAASNLYLIQLEVEYVLESLKRVEQPDPVRRDEIEHALTRAQMLIIQFKRTLTRTAQRSGTKLAAVQNGQRPAGSATSITAIGIPQRAEGQTQDVMLAFDKSVDDTFDQTKQIISELKDKKIKSVLIWDPQPRHLGEEARTLPILIASFLRTWPGIENITVVTPRPELVSRISPLVRGITLKEFNRQAVKFEEEPPEVVINFDQSISRPHVLGSVKTIPYMGRVFYLVFKWVYDGVAPLTYPEAVYATLKAFELDVPPLDQPIWERESAERKSIFINPHSVTNREYFDRAKDSWADAIVRLVQDKGCKVILNAGEPEKDDQNTLALVKAVRARIGETDNFAVLMGNIQKLFETINRAEGVITVDSAVNQLAHLGGVPCVIITTPNSKYWVGSKERTLPFESFIGNADAAIEKFFAPTKLGRIANMNVMVQLQKLQAQGVADIEVINDMAFGDMPKNMRMPIGEAIAHARTKQLFIDTEGRFHLFGGGTIAENATDGGAAPLGKKEKRALREALDRYESTIENFERLFLTSLGPLEVVVEKVKALRPSQAAGHEDFASRLAKLDRKLDNAYKQKSAGIKKEFVYRAKELVKDLRQHAYSGHILNMAEYIKERDHAIARQSMLYGSYMLMPGSPEAAQLQPRIAEMDEAARRTIERNRRNQEEFDNEPIARFAGAIDVPYLKPGSRHEIDGLELVMHRERYPDESDREHNWGINNDYFFEIRKDGVLRDRLYFCVRKDGEGKAAVEVSMSFSQIAELPLYKISALKWLWQRIRDNDQTFKAYIAEKEDSVLIPAFFESWGTCSSSNARLLDRDPIPSVLAELLEEQRPIAIAGKLLADPSASFALNPFQPSPKIARGSPLSVFKELLRQDRSFGREELLTALSIEPDTLRHDVSILVNHLGLARSDVSGEDDFTLRLTDEARKQANRIIPFLSALQEANARPLIETVEPLQPVMRAITKDEEVYVTLLISLIDTWRMAGKDKSIVRLIAALDESGEHNLRDLAIDAIVELSHDQDAVPCKINHALTLAIRDACEMRPSLDGAIAARIAHLVGNEHIPGQQALAEIIVRLCHLSFNNTKRAFFIELLMEIMGGRQTAEPALRRCFAGFNKWIVPRYRSALKGEDIEVSGSVRLGGISENWYFIETPDEETGKKELSGILEVYQDMGDPAVRLALRILENTGRGIGQSVVGWAAQRAGEGKPVEWLYPVSAEQLDFYWKCKEAGIFEKIEVVGASASAERVTFLGKPSDIKWTAVSSVGEAKEIARTNKHLFMRGIVAKRSSPKISAEALIDIFDHEEIRDEDGIVYSLAARKADDYPVEVAVYLNKMGEFKMGDDNKVLNVMLPVDPSANYLVISEFYLNKVRLDESWAVQDLTGKKIGSGILRLLGEKLPPGFEVSVIVGEYQTREQLRRCRVEGNNVVTEGGFIISEKERPLEGEVALRDVLALTLWGHVLEKAGFGEFQISIRKENVGEMEGLPALRWLLENPVEVHSEYPRKMTTLPWFALSGRKPNKAPIGSEPVPVVKDEENWGAALADIIKVAAKEAKDRARRENKPELATLLIGVEAANWIPAEQQAMMQPLLNEIALSTRLESYLRKLGLDNVKIVAGSGDELANKLVAAQGEHKVAASNVVVLATDKTLASDSFKDLRSTEAQDRAFFAQIDPANLTGFNYIRLCEMLTVSLKLAFGYVVVLADHPELDIKFDDKVRRIIRLIPKAEKKDPKELEKMYERQAAALRAA